MYAMFLSPHSGELHILILVWIHMALASHFLVCLICCEPVVGFLLKFRDIQLGHNKEMIVFW